MHEPVDSYGQRVTENWWTIEHPRLRVTTTRAAADTGRPPVLLLHGLWHAGWAWENWSARLAARGHDCHAVDLRGHGASEGDVRMAHLDDFAEDARRVVAVLPQAPIVIGHSLGGTLVERLLVTDRYPAAVLVAGVPGRYPVRTVLRTAITRPFATWASIRRADLLPLVASPAGARDFLFGPDVSEETVRRVQPRLGPAAPHVIRQLVLTRAPVPRAGTPTLVLAATHDAAFRPRAQRRRARAIDACYLEADRSGHDVPLDHGWGDAVDRVIDWLATIERLTRR